MPRRRRTVASAALLERVLAAPAEAGDETADRIVEAAFEQAEDFGLRRFTMEDVARRVGLSRVTVYRYFPGKDRLLHAILMRELRRFLDRLDAVVSRQETVDEKLTEGLVFAF